MHKSWTTVAALDPDTGEVARFDRVPNTREAFAEVLGGLQGPLHGVMEAGRNGWAMYDEIRPLFQRLLVADPRELKHRMAGRGAKTERRDALKMALVLAEDRVPAVAIPSLETRDLRTLTRGKVRLTQIRTQVINQIRSLCATFGKECPAGSLRTNKAQEWLDQVELPPFARFMLRKWRQLFRALQESIAQVEKRVERVAAKNGDAQLLRTMPGVGDFIALSLVAEIGDVRRFRHGKALVGYSGLAPQVYQSGERTHYGPLPRSGNRWLRYVMVLAAQHVARSRQETFLRRRYWRVQFRHGPNPAKVATARKMLTVARHLLVRQEPFAEPSQAHC